MSSLMDEICYETNNGINLLTMSKYLPAHA
jgi:hypothetical protein